MLSRTLSVCATLALLTGCMDCQYLAEHPVVASASGQKLCARHHIPLVTTRGYTLCEDETVIFHFHGKSNIMDNCNPNHIDPHYSLVRTKRYCKRASVTYCPACEGAWQKHWASSDREKPASWWEQMQTNIHLIPQ